MDILELLFAFDIPDNKDSEKYYKHYHLWIEKYILPTFSRAFSLNDSRLDKFIEKMMKSIRNMFEDEFIDTILNELPIMNKIFYYCRSEDCGITLKKRGLNCLANMIRLGLCENDDTRRDVAHLADQNNVMEILIDHLA